MPRGKIARNNPRAAAASDRERSGELVMGISIGLVGLGSFGSAFAPLFKHHPLVDRIALCDLEPDRVKTFAERPDFQDKFNPRDAYESLDHICKADLDALVIITQHWLHAPQAVQAMETGKHVYSAVPIICIPDIEETLGWCDKLVETCKRTGMHYMLGETTYYRAQTMFCRRKAAEGAFGRFIYTEGEYMHPFDSPGCDLRDVYRRRMSTKAGPAWEKLRQAYTDRGILNSPMTYPTHSTSGPMTVMNAHALKVTAHGFKPHSDDPFFDTSAFSNVAAFYEMSNGSSMRICEFREAAYPGGTGFEHEIFRVFGTKGTFRENLWMVRDKATKLGVDDMRDPLPPEVRRAYTNEDGESVAYGGHGGSHAYLVHEFVDAIANSRMPAINVWEACRYIAAGCAAHQSAVRYGERLPVPDWGDAPTS